jgi:hypothetical protein
MARTGMDCPAASVLQRLTCTGSVVRPSRAPRLDTARQPSVPALPGCRGDPTSPGTTWAGAKIIMADHRGVAFVVIDAVIEEC